MRLAIATAGLIAIGAQRARRSVRRSRGSDCTGHVRGGGPHTTRLRTARHELRRRRPGHVRDRRAPARWYRGEESRSSHRAAWPPPRSQDAARRRSRHASGRELLDRAAGRRARTASGGAFRSIRTGRGRAIAESFTPPSKAERRPFRRSRRSRLDPPLRGGPWVALYDPSLKGGHGRRFTRRPRPSPGRFAIDCCRPAAPWFPIPATGPPTGTDLERRSLQSRTASSRRRWMSWPNPTPKPVAPEIASGNYVAIDLGGGRFAFYEHLQRGSVAVKTGERVTRGQVVARLGGSGSTSIRPRLRFMSPTRFRHSARVAVRIFQAFESQVGTFQSLDTVIAGRHRRPRAGLGPRPSNSGGRGWSSSGFPGGGFKLVAPPPLKNARRLPRSWPWPRARSSDRRRQGAGGGALEHAPRPRRTVLVSPHRLHRVRKYVVTGWSRLSSPRSKATGASRPRRRASVRAGKAVARRGESHRVDVAERRRQPGAEVAEDVRARLLAGQARSSQSSMRPDRTRAGGRLPTSIAVIITQMRPALSLSRPSSIVSR